ncbi:MAG TPA: DUF6295 family protein [Solirubrobacteraceae bacterium]|jgi:dienelactone hydrolase|nr:DUF6295 family protein [Solirubrobacteraceae bacterium]
MSDSLCAETVLIGGDDVEAYRARPAGEESRGGVVVIHHMPGYDRATKEIARRFAARVAVELTAASARELVAAIEAALESAPAELTA